MERNKFFRKAKGYVTHLPLFVKFFTTMTALIIVSYLVLATALLVFLVNRWTIEKQQVLADNARQNAEYCETIILSCKDDVEALERAAILLGNNLRVTSKAIGSDVFFCDVEGRVGLCQHFFNYGNIQGKEGCEIHNKYQIPKEIIAEVAKDEYFATTKINSISNGEVFIAGAPVIINNELVGVVFAVEHVELSRNEYVTSIMKMYGSSILFSISLSFLFAYAFTARLTNPLRQMSNATKAYAKGDFSKRIVVRGKDEFAELCQSFNQMASTLSVLESSRRSFVANVSHELKTPMTTISGFVDGILDGTIPKEKHSEYLQIVSNEVKRLSRLVVSMLNLSKIEAGELELKYSKFDISSTIIDCLLNFEQEIEKKNIDIVGLDEIGSVIVNADRDMIHQVIYNLVDNAVKFTNENGEISVSVKEDGNRYDISIQNTGEGVSPDEIGRIFERFYKVDKSRSYDVKSAGLGLYLCKTIIDMHAGKISAESVQGQYIRFTISLEKATKEKN